jgi:hypothetical protein
MKPSASPLRRHAAAWALVCALACGLAQGADEGPAPTAFATPELAAAALVEALRHDDSTALQGLLGPASGELLSSGDAVADRRAREHLLEAYDAAHRIDRSGTDEANLRVGSEDWPMPIPLVQAGGRWHFDAASSRQKILDRRVGRNELAVIEVCRAYVSAQREFAALHPLGAHRHEYALRFDSQAGRRDGLYWPTAADEAPSPLGPLVARARAEGYGEAVPGAPAVPYHGYYYRILTAQGPHAPGGARDYLVDGHLARGFALVAFPARWGDSGIMTFLVSQDGIVFERNLGPQTERLARALTRFDPDLDWHAP